MQALIAKADWHVRRKNTRTADCFYKAASMWPDRQPAALLAGRSRTGNNSGELRAVLLFDVWRPELSQMERSLVSTVLASIRQAGGVAPA